MRVYWDVSAEALRHVVTFFEEKARSGTGSPKIQGPRDRSAPAVETQQAKSTGTTATATESATTTTMATKTTTTGAIEKIIRILTALKRNLTAARVSGAHN